MQVSIKAMRVNCGLTQEEVAKAVGVTKWTIINWENGRTVPTLQQFDAMCKIYNCGRDDIFLPEKQT